MYERYFPRQQIVVMQMERLVGSDDAVAQVFDRFRCKTPSYRMPETES